MQLQYLNQADLPVDYTYDGYKIGGLSGIDYDPVTDTYIAQSDFGADGKPAAVYSFRFTGLYNSDGTPQIEFEKTPIDLSQINNVESIRRDPNGDGFWVTTEETLPGIYHYHSDGSLTKLGTLPNNIETNAQADKSLKGSTFSPDGSYFVSMERNLTTDATGYTRITKFDKDGNAVAQYAYYTDKPSAIGATSNGISEILALDNNTLLVMERGDNTNQAGATTGASRNRVRIYKVSLIGAQNVLNITNLDETNTQTLGKTKVFDSQDPSIISQLDTNQTKIDNIEGMTLGSKMADGRQSLILVSDNNFNAGQYKTQFLSLALDDGDACFLAGTFIRTQQGMKRIEDIVPGDLVYSLTHNNIWQLRQVIWAGRQTATVAAYKPDDLSGYPVCIRKNAFEEGVPFADLYVTAEHCMFFDDCFVPIRLLVNGKTIFYDRSFTTYEYYHIEIEEHSIIAANGALSESYLDTGNRHYFTSQALSHVASSGIKNWNKDAAARLITQRGGVKAIFDQLNCRADQLSIQPVGQKQERTSNPNLYLITDDRSKIIPTEVTDKEVLFELPSTVKNVRLISKTYRPCDVLGSFVDNRHVLGVMVGNVSVSSETQKQNIDVHLSGGDLSGWLPQSQPNARWTSGNALIPLKSIKWEKNIIMSIQIVETGSYLVNE